MNKLKNKISKTAMIMLISALFFGNNMMAVAPWTITSNSMIDQSKYPVIVKDGTWGDPVSNPSSNVGQLQDNSFIFTNADEINDTGFTIDSEVTILVIDDGMTLFEWEALEENPYAPVNMLGVVTRNVFNQTIMIDDLQDANAQFLEEEYQINHGHGFSVISTIGALANNVNIIFADVFDYGDYPDYDEDLFGWYYEEIDLWDWIYDNLDTYDIDVISFSYSSVTHFAPVNSDIDTKMGLIKSSGVFMVSSAGNIGNQFNGNYMYPQIYPTWYIVGSIDHENRTEDSQEVSVEGEWTGTATSSPFTSSWYETWDFINTGVKWIMPGNGVPIMVNAHYDSGQQIFTGDWVYGVGTSFSTPMAASAAAIAISEYHRGILNSTDPTIETLENIILESSSDYDTYNMYRGYGYINFYLLLSNAYDQGVSDR